MGNNRNKNKKRRGWRKETGKHMIEMKTQIPPIDVEINSDETNIHTLQNIELSQVPPEDTSCSLNIQSDERMLQNIELSQVPPEDTSCSLNIQSDERMLDPYSHNFPQYDTSDDECDHDTNWYEVSFNYPVEEKSCFCVEGRRMIDVEYFYKRLQEICNHNQAFGCTLINVHIISEKRKGLLSKYKLACNMCNLIFYLDSEPKSDLDLNKSATSGIISSGIGYSQFSELCASMDCPSFSQKHYAKVQDEIYDDWRKTAIITMETAASRERDAAIAEGRVKNGIACIDVIADGVWSKRSFNTNNFITLELFR